MASKTQDALFKEFQAIRPEGRETVPGFLELGSDFLPTVGQGPADTKDAKNSSISEAIVNPGDVLTGIESTHRPTPTASATDSFSIAGTALSVASKVFESGLGLVPLVSGLLGLFGGGGSASPPPLQRYAMPEQLYFTGADTGSGFGEADYDRFGMPRLYESPGAGEIMGAGPTSPLGEQGWPSFGSSFGPGYSGSGTASGGASNLVSERTLAGESNNASGRSSFASPQINVNIQAMDTQSFLDHSDEIAQAVRQAMLSLNSINDV